MKWIAFLIPVFFSVAHAQQSMTISTPKPETTATLDPNWEVRIGQTNLTVDDESNFRSSASGLTIGGRYDFNSMFAVGGDFTSYKLRQTIDDGFGSSYTETRPASVLSAMAEFTPITTMSFAGGVSFNGSILGGAMFGSKEALGDVATMFYGAALAVDFQKQIGLRLESKVATAFNSMTTLSIVGYY